MSEVSSVALAGLMFALIGMALDWSFGWSGLAAVSMAFATWASRSLSRAFYCLFASIGVVSAVVSAAILLHLPLADLGVTWTFVCVGFWLLVIGFGLLLRTADVDRDFGMMEIVGALMTTVFAYQHGKVAGAISPNVCMPQRGVPLLQKQCSARGAHAVAAAAAARPAPMRR